MKNYYEKRTLSHVELAVLEIIKKIGFKSAFQMAEKLSGTYDTLTVMRSLHALLQMELLVRYNVQGERYYTINERKSAKIRILLDHTKIETPILSHSKS